MYALVHKMLDASHCYMDSHLYVNPLGINILLECVCTIASEDIYKSAIIRF